MTSIQTQQVEPETNAMKSHVGYSISAFASVESLFFILGYIYNFGRKQIDVCISSVKNQVLFRLLNKLAHLPTRL